MSWSPFIILNNDSSWTVLHLLKTWAVSFINSALWFTPELHQLKSRGRRLERLYKLTGPMVHRELYNERSPL